LRAQAGRCTKRSPRRSASHEIVFQNGRIQQFVKEPGRLSRPAPSKPIASISSGGVAPQGAFLRNIIRGIAILSGIGRSPLSLNPPRTGDRLKPNLPVIPLGPRASDQDDRHLITQLLPQQPHQPPPNPPM